MCINASSHNFLLILYSSHSQPSYHLGRMSPSLECCLFSVEILIRKTNSNDYLKETKFFQNLVFLPLSFSFVNPRE